MGLQCFREMHLRDVSTMTKLFTIKSPKKVKCCITFASEMSSTVQREILWRKSLLPLLTPWEEELDRGQ